MDGQKKQGWDPPVAILVFCFLQGVIFLLMWSWFLWQLARDAPLVSTGAKALAKGVNALP